MYDGMTMYGVLVRPFHSSGMRVIMIRVRGWWLEMKAIYLLKLIALYQK